MLSPLGHHRLARRYALIGAVGGLALVLCGCGGSSAKAGGSPARPNATHIRAQFVAYASCMRAHGLSTYPDPQISSSSGGVRVTISPGGLNPSTPAFKAADKACHSLLPDGGGPPPAASSPQQRARAVRFASCLRAHGVQGFPDPERDGAFDLPPTIDPQAPQFKAALKACAKVRPDSLMVNQSAPSGA